MHNSSRNISSVDLRSGAYSSNLVKDGIPSRGEMSDVAMSERAECVMLNKGPFIAEAIDILDDVVIRMEAHQVKKTPQLRALHSW